MDAARKKTDLGKYRKSTGAMLLKTCIERARRTHCTPCPTKPLCPCCLRPTKCQVGLGGRLWVEEGSDGHTCVRWSRVGLSSMAMTEMTDDEDDATSCSHVVERSPGRAHPLSLGHVADGSLGGATPTESGTSKCMCMSIDMLPKLPSPVLFVFR